MQSDLFMSQAWAAKVVLRQRNNRGFSARHSNSARSKMHLSPECAAPLEAALLWPPTLLRPPMLRTLPAPVRDERIVLAFVATVSASATCRARPHFLNLLTPRHKVLRKPFSRAACSCTTGVAGLDSVLHSVLGGQQAWLTKEVSTMLTDLALALCMPRRKPPICRRSSKSLSSLALSSKPPPGRLLGFGAAQTKPLSVPRT